MTTAETGPQPIDEPLSDQEAQFLISVFEDNANLLRTMTQIDLQWVAAVMTFYAVGAGLLFTSPPSKVEIMNYVIVRIAYLMICLLSASFVSSKLNHNHSRRKEAVAVIKNAQAAMGFFQKDRYIKNARLIDKKFENKGAAEVYRYYKHAFFAICAIKSAVFVIFVIRAVTPNV